MDNLEKNLLNLPQPKLGLKADLKIRFKIYLFIFAKKLSGLAGLLLIKNLLLRKTVLALLIIFVILCGTSVYAAANDNITLGDTLYPLKKTIENVEQGLSVTRTSKVDTLGKFSERRIKEALNLTKEDGGNNESEQNIAVDNIRQTINSAVDNIDSAVKTSQEINNNKSAKKAQDAIKKNNDAIIQYLDNIENIAKTNKNEAVISEVNKAKATIHNYNEILDKDKNKRHEDRIESVDIKNSDSKNQDEHKNNSGDGVRQDTQTIEDRNTNSDSQNDFEQSKTNDNRGDND